MVTEWKVDRRGLSFRPTPPITNGIRTTFHLYGHDILTFWRANEDIKVWRISMRRRRVKSAESKLAHDMVNTRCSDKESRNIHARMLQLN